MSRPPDTESIREPIGRDRSGLSSGQRGFEGGHLERLQYALSRATEDFPAVFEEEKRFNPAGATRAAEEAALLDYAEKNDLLLDAGDFFRRWRDSGAHGGNEHQVIIGDEGQPVEKRTNIPYFHDTWLEYFKRIEIHNKLFPESSFTVKGIQYQNTQMWTPHGDITPAGIYVVTEQPFVKWEREATPAEIASFLTGGGFQKVPVAHGERDVGEWFSLKTKIIFRDVRGDNVVIYNYNGISVPVVLDLPIKQSTHEEVKFIEHKHA